MSRTANAVLVVTVQDTPLDDHIRKMDQVKAAWATLNSDVSRFSTNAGAASADLKKMSTALAALGSIQSGGGVGQLLTTLGNAGPAIQPLVTAITALAPLMKSLSTDTKAWARSLITAGQAVSSIDARVNTLIQSQQKTTTHLTQFGAALDVANQKLKTQGAELLKLVQGYAGFNRAVAVANSRSGGGGGGQNAGERFKGFMAELASFERFFIRNATTLFIAGMWIKHAAEAFREATVQIDLNNVLGLSLEKFPELMEKTRHATRGMVSDLQIMKSAALMSSFKIPMENFAQNMALVQKMAVRTGQSTTYMFDSLARGVSRLSPAILDNLGIQIKLKDAYAAGAAALGISVDEMDSQAKKVAVLAEVTRQMADATKEVNPAASLQARLDEAIASYDNFSNKVKGAMLQATLLIASTAEERLSIVSDRLKLLGKEYDEFGKSMSDQTKNILVATDPENQKNIDMIMTFGVANLATQMEAIRQGKDVTQYLREQLILTNAIYDVDKMNVETREKLAYWVQWEADKRKFALSLMEKRLEQEKELVKVQRLFEMSQRATSGLDTGDMAARQAGLVLWVARYETVTNKVTQLNREMDLYRKNIGVIGKEIGGPEGSTFVTNMGRGLSEMQERLQTMTAAAAADKTGTLTKVLFGPGGFDIMVGNVKWLEEAVRRQAAATTAEFKIKNAAAIQYAERVQAGVESRQRELALLQGTTASGWDLAKAQKEVTDATKEYEKTYENLAVLGKGELDMSNEQLDTASKALAQAQEKLEIQLQVADTEKWFSKYLTENKNGAEKLNKLEFLRLSNGRSILQLKAEESKLGLALLAIEERRVEASKKFTSQSIMRILLDSMESGSLKNKIAEIEKLLDRAPTPPGGGGRDKKEHVVKEAKQQGEELKAVWTNFLDFGDQYMVESFDGSKDRFGNFISEVKNMAYTETDGHGLFGTLFFGNTAGALDENEKRIAVYQERIDEILKSMKDPKNVMFGPEGQMEIDKLREWMKALSDANNPLREHIKLMLDAAMAMHDYGDANDIAYASAKGILGDDVIAAMTNFGHAVSGLGDEMAKALSGQSNAYSMLAAGIPMIQAFTNAFITDQKKRAVIEMMMQGAMAWAAYPNVPKMLAHGTAAIMFGAVAGGRVRLPSASRKDTKDAQDASTTKGGDMHFHLYADMVNTDAEKGQLLDRLYAEARAQGR